MWDDSLRATDRPRAVRRWSLARRVWCDAQLPAKLRESLGFGNPDDVLFESIPLQVKDRCVVGRHDWESGPLLIKRHTWGGLFRTARMAFREPAARRCARLGIYLHDRGIPTPRPRATAVFRIGPWTRRSYLVSDYVEGTPLYRYIRFASQTGKELSHVAEQVARIWQRLIEMGVSHNDFKPENFIVDKNLNVWLIDLEKVRIGGKRERQRERQVFDVNNFLHIRGWHRRAGARAMFAQAFLQTPYRDWLVSSGIERVAAGYGLCETERDTDLSVLLVCDGGIDFNLARQAINSVQGIADEIVLVEPTNDRRLKELKRIDVCGCQNPTTIPWKLAARPYRASIARYEWVLVVHQNECVTPFLAKELQQRIANSEVEPAIRIPRERQYFGRSLGQARGEQPVRLFHQSKGSFALDGESLKVSAGTDRMSQLTGTIQVCAFATVAEFIEWLNERSTSAASRRFANGERARILRTAWRGARQFLSAYSRNGGLRGGSTSLQIAALEAVFSGIEEAKLHQLAGEFRAASSYADATGFGAIDVAGEQATSATPRSKAA
jgi:tRNA A-37 threonylcarbamoyl transferase component Bud32